MAEQTTNSTSTQAGYAPARSTRLHRAHDGRLGGVCAGIAQCTATDADTVRLIAVMLTVLTVGLLAVVYLVLWLVLPVEEAPVREVDGLATSLSSEVYGAVADAAPAQEGRLGLNRSVLAALVVGIVALAAIMSFLLSGMTRSFEPWQFWPLVLVAAGIARLVIPDASGHHGVSVALGSVLFFLGMVLLLATLGLAQLNARAWLVEGAPLLVAAAGLFLMGRGLDSQVLVLCAIAAIAAFCAVGVLFYLEPGAVRQIVALLPNGREVSIVVLM